MTSKSLPQKILKGILHTEDEKKHTYGRNGNIKPQEKNRQVLKEYAPQRAAWN
jgi:hypothetical protein